MQMFARRLIASLFSACGVVVLGFVTQTAVASVDEPSIQLSSSTTLAQLIELSAQQYSVDIEYTPSDLSRPITLRPAAGYTRSELWKLTHQLLEAAGSTTVLAPGGRLYRVVRIAQADESTAAMNVVPHPPPGYIRLSYPLTNIDPETVITATGKMKQPFGQLSPTPGGNAIVVGALTRRHDEVQAMIESLETIAAASRQEVVQLDHAQAVEVIAAVNASKEQLPGRALRGQLSPGVSASSVLLTSHEHDRVRWLELIERYDAPPGTETLSYPLPAFGADGIDELLEQAARINGPQGSGESWAVVRNDLIGNLIITASPSEHDNVAALLDQIAAIPAEQLRSTRTYVVQNRNAEDLRGSLSKLLGVSLGGGPGGAPATDSESSAEATSLSNSQPPDGRFESTPNGLVMAVDPELNAIIAVGSPRQLDEVQSLIERLDVRQPQVQLEVVLVSLSEGESLDLGVELQAQISDTGTLIGLGSLFGLSTVSPGDTSPTVGGSGGTAVILDPGNFSAVIKALESINQGRSVSRASALVNNNESASLNNTVNQPFATTTISDGNPVNGFGGSQPAGTQVSVSPQIAAGDFLVLDYDVSLSAFLGEATSDGLPPPSQSTSVTSVATIPDGYSIAVGGLELLTQSDADTKTPLLSEVPILGNLFKSTSESASRTRFYVFIRASILRNPGFERLRYLSDVAREEAEVDLGWPQMKPQIIR